MDNLGIHNRLKEARKTLNLNQLVIATDLGIHQKSISEIENGKIINIPNTYIYYFYKKGISLDWIYAAIGPMLLGENISSKTSEQKSMSSSLDSLFEKVKPSEQDEIKTIEPIFKENVEPKNTDMFERLIDSKDMTIKSLLTYIQSVENNLEFIKSLLLQKK